MVDLKDAITYQTNMSPSNKKGMVKRKVKGVYNGRGLSDIERLKHYYNELSPKKCWNWKGGIDSKGYGRFYYKGNTRPAHRIAYILLVGKFPEELTVDHLCKNTKCINPSHMEVVTQSVNTLRSNNPMALNARKTHCFKGHKFTPENTYHFSYRKGRQCRVCWLNKAKMKTAKGRASLHSYKVSK